MQITPVEQLKDEHQAILLALGILEKICHNMEQGKEINSDHLEKILEFIKVFVNKCHHGKEESLLFPAMLEAGFPKEGGPIEIMLGEHNLGRGHVRGMAEGLSEYQSGKNPANFIKNAVAYIGLLRPHIEKENNILYPAAEMHLGKAKQNQLLKQFEELEREKIGPGKHEKFHQLLDDLEKIYLK